ncbi:hypothetical protein OEZ85_006095 [Tetradesmus obliquus]|uniref:Thioredoxin domain-containing protein n=1 Tax=Tetradesmus obliquus TaxID=3088 RepID=A0ABY8UFX2_TETOB|nr:hypothetical protein OEZ85_006095 [Tetradesmus obliquus]
MHKSLIIATLLVVSLCFAAAQQPLTSPKQAKIPASSNVTDLTEYTFKQTADGRVWFVEFYADFCRNCRRIASHVSMLADNLTATAPHIVVARLNCEEAERFCNDDIRISRTPEMKVYYLGKHAITYRSDFFFFDMMHEFITNTAANILGWDAPDAAAAAAGGEGEGEDDDEYDDAAMAL